MRFLDPSDLSRPLPVSLGISGGSGSGKTYSSLRVARGMATELVGAGAPIAYADTENRRALHYRDAFPELLSHYLDFGPEDDNGKLVGYAPERWMEALDFIERSDAGAVVIDSFSAGWEGIGGVLDLQAEILAQMGGGDQNSLRAWGKIKPRYRKLINRLIQFKKPIIVCTRAKPQIVDPKTGKNMRPNKIRRPDVAWDVAADGDLIFEYSAMVILDPLHPGCPVHQVKVPDQFKLMMPADRPLTEETGRELARWSRDQKAASATKAIMDGARSKAREGSAALAAWWKTTSQEERAMLLPIGGELRETAAAADAAPGKSSDDFFDKPPAKEQPPADDAASSPPANPTDYARMDELARNFQ